VRSAHLRYVSVKAISVASGETAQRLVAAAPTSAMMQLILAYCTDSHHQARCGCALALSTLLASSLTPSDKQLADVSKALKGLLCDADPKVREAAGKSYWVLAVKFVATAEALHGKLEPNAVKLVKRLKPKA
jgi:hypothetical protein